jgi:hypothetical protein
MKPRVAGNGEQTTRMAASAAAQSWAGATAPQCRLRPSAELFTSVKAGPCRAAGGRNSSAMRPHTSCTSSMITYDRPKVMSSSGTWPYLCTLRRHRRSNSAPSAPTRTGATSRAGQKPVKRETV